MTAQTIVPGAVVAPVSADRRLAGLGTLLRKDATEWIRGKRAWVVFLASALFMTLSAANGWIISRIAGITPDGEPIPVSQVPLDNLLAAVGSQLFVLAAILAVASVVVSERQAGTLAWVASKPVSRRAIWLSKWLSSSALLAVAGVILPMAATVALVVVLYGVPDPLAVAGLTVGMIAMVTFFTALGVAAGTVLPGVAAVAATGIVVFAALPAIGGLLPAELAAFLPTSILPWVAGLATGAPVPIWTPVAFVAALSAVVAFGLWRMDRLEL